ITAKSADASESEYSLRPLIDVRSAGGSRMQERSVARKIAMRRAMIAVFAAVCGSTVFVIHGKSAAQVAEARQPTPAAATSSIFQSSDLYRLKSIGDVQVSPDGRRIAYSIQNTDRPGRPYSQVWILDITNGRSTRLGSDQEAASGPRWSRDGQQIAYFGREETSAGVVISRADGSGAMLLAQVSGTNHPLPSSGERLARSPHGNQLGFIPATRGPQNDKA